VKKLPVTMRQDHAAGDKLFVDYAGDTVTVIVDRPPAHPRQMALLVLLNPDADKVARHVVAFCQALQRFPGEEFLHDLTFEFDAVTAVFCHWSSFRKPGRPVNSSSRSVHPKGRTPQGKFARRNTRIRREPHAMLTPCALGSAVGLPGTAGVAEGGGAAITRTNRQTASIYPFSWFHCKHPSSHAVSLRADDGKSVYGDEMRFKVECLA
jgi:hypothetical protein